jgi:hypothetical protein
MKNTGNGNFCGIFPDTPPYTENSRQKAVCLAEYGQAGTYKKVGFWEKFLQKGSFTPGLFPPAPQAGG